MADRTTNYRTLINDYIVVACTGNPGFTGCKQPPPPKGSLMCGIAARVGLDDSVGPLLSSLENLSYRGYDSAGVAVQNGTGITVVKQQGDVAELRAQIDSSAVRGPVGLGHTRWSTHGSPTHANAHPHTDCTGTVAVVHNGIIENHSELRARLEAEGHTFQSETDTEVIPHLVEAELATGGDVESAFRSAVAALRGSYAIAMLVEGDEHVYATRSGSPLVLGCGDTANYLASDVPAFIDFSDRVVFLEDGDFVVVGPTDYQVSGPDGEPLDRPVETVEWSAEDAKKEGYDHYMQKEIQEQPRSIQRTIQGRIVDGQVRLDTFEPGTFRDVSAVQLVGCGTSFHAGLYGERLIADGDIRAQTFLASEYAAYPPPVDDRTLVIGVTQSGETADTLDALRVAQDGGARTLALTNVVGSTASRESDDVFYLRAGPEIGVAATKTFSSQVAALVLLNERLATDKGGAPTVRDPGRLAALQALPGHVDSVLSSDRVPAVVERSLDSDAHFFIGRGSAYAAALEGALKFKEITYEHAEGFAAGELKHGPLALVTPDTPVIAVCTGRQPEMMESNIREIQSRGAPVVAIAPESMTAVTEAADDVLSVPPTHPDLVAVLANVQLQLIAYHAAVGLNRPIDKPRNLAKSVTVV